jgi:hypothetical protein
VSLSFNALDQSTPSGTELGHIRSPWARYALYAVLLLVLIFFAVIRVRLRAMPLERDEGEYAYSGQLILDGIPPYQFSYNMKLPGTYLFYSLIMAIGGQTPTAIRIGVLLVNTATSFLVFLLGKRLHGLVTGVVAGCTYALLSTRSSVLGFQGHATHFVTLTAVAGILLILYALETDRIEKNRLWLFFTGGLLLGLSIMMKQHGLFFALFAELYVLWIGYTQRPRIPFRDLFFRAGWTAVGIVLPFGLTCLILFHYGVFREFWFWTVLYGRAYASETGLGQGWKMIRAVGPWMARPFIISEIACVGLASLLWSEKVRRYAPFTLGLLFFSAIAVLPGYYFRPHYFILMLPAVALWTGIGVAATQEMIEKQRWRWAAGVPFLVFAIAFYFCVRGQRKFLFNKWNPDLALHDSSGCGDGCAEDKQAADYVKANSAPQDTVAVLGSEPAIYFYSHRHSATGYIYMYALTEPQVYAQQMRQEMISEVETARPNMVVYVDNSESWWNLGSSKETAYLEPLLGWVQSQYQLVQQIPIAGKAKHQWGDHAAFYIYRRRD